MIDVNDLRKGVLFEKGGNLYKVLDYHHNKPGRGNATIRVKTINLRNGTNLEQTFQSGDRVQDVRLDFHDDYNSDTHKFQHNYSMRIQIFNFLNTITIIICLKSLRIP